MVLQKSLQEPEKGLSISEFARICKVSRRTIYNWIKSGNVETLENGRISQSFVPVDVPDDSSIVEVDVEAISTMSLSDLIALRDEYNDYLKQYIESGDDLSYNIIIQCVRPLNREIESRKNKIFIL